MVMSSSSSENEPCCSKNCKKNTESLNSKIIDLTDKLCDSKNMLFHYKAETLKKEKEGLESKLTGFQIASKDLDNLLESQRTDKNMEGLGYNVVLPHHAQVYSPPKKDMSWTRLPKFTDDTITDYSRSSPAIEKIKADKVETVKKPTVKYAELYRKPSKKSNVRGNQKNWTNLKSQQLGENFVMKKECYNYGSIDHLSYNCGKWVDHGISWAKNNNTHKSRSPRTFFHKTDKTPAAVNRPNMNAAQLK
nr:hypothetical protein [Tanacetum cinerariifolium]